MERVLIKTTLDGRKVEVIDGAIYLDGKFETDHLVMLEEHPNRSVIMRVMPDATYVAGRLPLTMYEASTASAAMARAAGGPPADEQGIAERLRQTAFRHAVREGVDR